MTEPEVAALADRIVAEIRRRGPVEPLAVGETEAARLIGVSTRTLFTLRQAGGIPHTTIGTRIVYPVAELRTWLADQARGNWRTNDEKTPATRTSCRGD